VTGATDDESWRVYAEEPEERLCKPTELTVLYCDRKVGIIWKMDE
jgi:hypothetical protein